MLRRGLLLVVLALASVQAQKIACVGDSITAALATGDTLGYPSKLQNLLGPAYTVRNFGVSGTTLLRKGDFPYVNTPQFKDSFSFLPDIVILMLGTNDAKPQNWRFGPSDFQVDDGWFINQYRSIASKPKILRATTPPVFKNGTFGINPQVIREQIVPRIVADTRALNASLVDIFTAMSGHEEFFPDTVHPNDAGYDFMARVMADAVKRSQA